MVAINPFSALSTVGQASKDSKSIADNFDTFLTLLTTQLRNQNPLDPLDTNQFTQQLVQFTGVEQAVKTNKNLETLTSLAAATTITNAVGYIGKQVSASSATTGLSGGQASWQFSAARPSPAAILTVTNASGQTVWTESRALTQGANTFRWTGQTLAGGTAPDGVYTLAVNAADSGGARVPVSMETSGIVQGVDMSGNEPVLIVGGQTVRLDQITSVKLAPTI